MVAPVMTEDGLRIGEAARLAGISVRTLHHYDRIGLLGADGRTEGGYRRYQRPQLERLQRILAYRRLGLSLEEIAALLDDGAEDAVTHLRRQERLLRGRIAELEQMLDATHTMLEAYEMEINLSPEERFELFEGFDPQAHEAEAEQRWGGTQAWSESRRRTKAYGKSEWQQIKAEAQRIESEFAELMQAGVAATSPRALELAEEHRRHISRWFYECSPRMHRGLGEMYVADQRFADHYEQRAPGLAAYVSAAVAANAARLEDTGPDAP